MKYKEAKIIKSKEGKVFSLKQKLCCKNYGIYAAQCIRCAETYVGQTSASFSKRWNGPRAAWRKFSTNPLQDKDKKHELNEEQALLDHYLRYHKEHSNIQLSEAYNITFIEEPKKHNLDVAENYWIAKLNSKINVIKSNFPRCN